MPPADSTQSKISQASRGAERSRAKGGRESSALASARLWPLFLALVVLAALLPYWKSLDYGFVWDDTVIIPKVETYGPGDAGRLLATPFDSFLGDPMKHPNYFRPVTLLSFWLDRGDVAGRPKPYHRTNLLLYAVACVFLWLFVWELSGSPAAAAAGVVVFAFHPAHPENVSFISGRTDLLAGAFLFASLWLAARWGKRIRNPVQKLAPSALVLLLALFSKEVAFFASPIPWIVLWIRDRSLRPRELVLAAVPLALADAIYLACRWNVLGVQTVPAVSPVEGLLPQILTSVAVVGRYVPLLLFPVSMSARHEVLPLQRPDLYFVLGAITLALVAAGLVLLARRRSRWLLPLAIVATTLLPLCNVRIIAGALVAERFLYIPSAALALAVAFLPRSIPYAAAAVAGVVYLMLLLPRVAIWKNDAALYTSMLRDSPNSPHVHAILGGFYYRQRDLPRAIAHQKRAFQLLPAYNETLLDLAAAEDESGQTDSALIHIELLLRLRPHYSPAWYALGNFYVRADRPDSAVAAYREAIRLSPGFAQAENNLGVVLERMGRTEEAIAQYRRAVEVLPGYPEATNNLARLTAGPKP